MSSLQSRTYRYGGRDYVELGELRVPQKGEVYLMHVDFGNEPAECADPELLARADGRRRKILTPKEEKVSDEYQIPVLVPAKWASPCFRKTVCVKAAKVVMCRQDESGTWWDRDNESWSAAAEAVAYPSQAQVEAEQAKLRPQADSLPPALTAFLSRPNPNVCQGARDWAKEFATLLLASVPKGEA